MSLNLATILSSSARERPGHPAILLNERSIDFAELDRAARGVASHIVVRVDVAVVGLGAEPQQSGRNGGAHDRRPDVSSSPSI